MAIVTVNVDEAAYFGEEADGVYVQTGQDEDGKWYVSTLIDSDTGHFVQALRTDDGPYDTEAEALTAGKNVAIDWCIDNGVMVDELNIPNLLE